MFNFNNSISKHGSIANAFNITQRFGTSIPIYMQKAYSNISRDRVVAGFISDKSVYYGTYEHTVISAVQMQTTNENSSYKYVNLMSNKQLTYMGLMGLIYRLRLDGMIISDIANISYKNDKSLIAVEEIHSNDEILHISIGDKLKGMTNEIIMDNDRSKETHYISIINIQAIEYSDNAYSINKLLNEVVNTNSNWIDYFDIEGDSRVKLYSIYEFENFIYIIKDCSIVVFTLHDNININNTVSSIKNRLNQMDIDYTLDVTPSIIML